MDAGLVQAVSDAVAARGGDQRDVDELLEQWSQVSRLNAERAESLRREARAMDRRIRRALSGR